MLKSWATQALRLSTKSNVWLQISLPIIWNKGAVRAGSVHYSECKILNIVSPTKVLAGQLYRSLLIILLFRRSLVYKVLVL